ncbi:MAG: glycosyltransferase family 2 protein [Ardenticatenales bacterium]
MHTTAAASPTAPAAPLRAAAPAASSGSAARRVLAAHPASSRQAAAPPAIVASVVLNWNRRELTLRCLESLTAMRLPAGVEHRVVVVDNGSTDGSVDAIRAAHPAAAIVALPINVGFAAGANAGLRRALDDGAAWTLVVNNDTVAAPTLLTELYAGALVAEIAPAAIAGRPARRGPLGIAAPTVTYVEPAGVVWPSAGFRRGWTLAARDTTAHPPSDRPYDIDWANGCCFLARRALWERIGLFDERYRVYYEDHDLCLRARAAGFRLAHVPSARIAHHVAASTGVGTPAQAYLLARSSVPYYLANTRGAQRAFIVVYRALSLGRTIVRSLAAGRSTTGAAYVRGLVDGVRDRRAGH